MEKLFIEMGEQEYRGRQLFKWLYNNRLGNFDGMSDFSTGLRAKLAEQYEIKGLIPAKTDKSKDGTTKFLFMLDDGNPIESVLIPDGGRSTLCISSQSGCTLDCKFCATGQMGLLRNLTKGEILSQLLFIRNSYGEDSFSNVVFMGMGEPLNNYGNMMDSLSIMTESLGMGIGAKKIVVSTAGISPRIRKLADSKTKVRLAISLNSAIQKKT